MPESLSNVLVHIIFSTKERRPFLRDPAQRVEMHRYLAGISGRLHCTAILIGGAEDHVHLFACQSRTISLADWVKELRRASSLWAKEQGESFRWFQWQRGYGAFSVSQSQRSQMERYIARQEEHHKRVSFQDEFRLFLEKNGISYDERYVWD